MKKLLVLCIAMLLMTVACTCWQAGSTGGQQVVYAEPGRLRLEWTEPYYCQMVSVNVGICDLPAYINMVVGLLQDGYELEQCERLGQTYDYILSAGEGDKFRIYYGGDGRVTSIAFRYEDSARPFTYINESGRNEVQQGDD